LIGFSRLDVVDVDLELLCPIFERVGDEFRSIVATDAIGLASIQADLYQGFYETLRLETKCCLDPQDLTVEKDQMFYIEVSLETMYLSRFALVS
jgi:hypothetical protein